MKNEIYPCLWFNGQAKEAAQRYCSAFKNAKITVDTGMVVTFDLAGQKFMGLNGGPAHVPNPSISFFVVCETMAELEHAWETLLAGGQVLMPLATYEWSARYGWLQDQFNISWQLSLGKLEEVGQKFTPTLLFANQQASQAEPAIQFYTGIFHNSSVMGILKYNENSNEAAGRIKHAQFKLGQQVFMALDSSLPHSFIFTEGISLVVNCETQAEIDYYWNKLTEGGKAGRCGWLKD